MEADTNLSTDMAVAVAKKFLKTIAQPFSEQQQVGISTWSLEDLERHKGKIEDEKIRELQMEGLLEEGKNRDETDGVSGGVNDEFGGIDDEDMASMDI